MNSTAYYTGEPLRIGQRWQLLLDDTVVEDRFRLRRVLRPPAKFPHNPVMVRDRPWEGDECAVPHVIWDDALGRYRMWYLCFNYACYFGAPGAPYFICYAESDDAVNWEKPLLNGVLSGFDGTNVIYTGTYYPRVQGPQVWRDDDESDESRRYKMVCLEKRPMRDGSLNGGVQMAYSPDGLRWRLDEKERPLLDYHSDTHNHIVRAPDDSRWLLYCRPIMVHAGSPAYHGALPDGMTAHRHSGRRASVATSEDLLHWSYPRTVLYPDERDTPDIDQVIVFPAGNSLLMMYSAMEGDSTGCADVKLASSADGFNWHRFHTREPFIARGGPDAWDCGSILTACGPVRQGDQLLFYYRGSTKGQHEEGPGARGIGLAMTRIDRFVEQIADDLPGFLLTREFVLEGTELHVNASDWSLPNRRSELRVEILQHPPTQDITGFRIAYEGFSLADCDPIAGDHLDKVVTWNGSADLSSLQGKPVYLRFQLRNRGLCAFRVAKP